MKASQASATPPKQRRSQYATAPARAGVWGAWPAGLVALPLALAPSAAGAATITIGTACTLTGTTACLASNLLASVTSKDLIDFQGGALTLDVQGQTYAPDAQLGTIPTNILNQAGNDTTFTGVFKNATTNPGNIEIANTGSGGSVTFSNNKNSYTGSTTVDSGATLKLGTKGTIASSSTLADNGGFDISGAGGTVTIKDLSGNGTVALGGNTLTLSAAASMFVGGISGTGGLTVSGGTGTLSGNNTYTGATTINTGATLSIAGTGKIDKSSNVADSGTFDISRATTGSVSIVGLTGGGSVLLGGNTLTLSNPATKTTFSGNINGAGGVTIAAGTATFSGALAYIGTTTVNAGATLALSGTANTITSLSGAGSVTLSNNQTLTLSNASGIFSGVIGGGNPNTGLTIQAGTEALMGANTFKGATTVSPGAILTGTGSITGALINNGTVRPFDTVSNKAGTFTIGGAYSPGAGGILDIAIGSTPGSGNYSKQAVAGKATLTGSILDVDTFDSFQFPVGTSKYTSILSYGSKSGDFLGVSYNGSSCTGDGLDKWICEVGLTFTESFTSDSLDLLVAQTPEPGTLAILASGLLGLFGLRRRWIRSPR